MLKKLSGGVGSKFYLLASEADRQALEAGPLGHLVHYQAPQGAPILNNVFPLAAVAASDSGAEDLEEVCNRLATLRSLPPLPMLRLPDVMGPGAVAVAELVTGPLARIARYASNLNSQLLDIKRERDQLLENYRALEDTFNAQAMRSVSCVFEHQPYSDPADEGIEDLLVDGGITQLLPVASTGISGFALHIRATGTGHSGLRLRLECVEDEAIVGEWIVASAQVGEGWNYFVLPRALPNAARSLRLHLDADGEGAPEPSVGQFLAQEVFAAKAQRPHPDIECRPLAFRLYAGIPGVRPDGVLNMLATVAASGAPSLAVFRLPEQVLETVELCTEIGPGIDYPLVQYLPHEASVVCHPQLHGPTCAVMRGAVPVGTQWVQSKVWIAHPNGMPAYAAMLVLDPEQPIRDQVTALPPVTAEAAFGGFSGWRQVTGGDGGTTVHLSVTDGAHGPRDLLLVSMPAASQVDFSWLHFTEVRMARQFTPRG
ncbi:DUF6212 domain-containing protein [Siccirubricoccus deserti]|uniref:Uncharacterized protein n=1 Tax=Siccirubricoccus deserti TaxID=2013562 RepID=A0A9X0UGE0_9PROT|nr:DUF6212 domain-containing protein [Siccirubricoccus deserti]MBC4018823.1 hypothetical protein [Siccirubricoccus deserti]